MKFFILIILVLSCKYSISQNRNLLIKDTVRAFIFFVDITKTKMEDIPFEKFPVKGPMLAKSLDSLKTADKRVRWIFGYVANQELVPINKDGIIVYEEGNTMDGVFLNSKKQKLPKNLFVVQFYYTYNIYSRSLPK